MTVTVIKSLSYGIAKNDWRDLEVSFMTWKHHTWNTPSDLWPWCVLLLNIDESWWERRWRRVMAPKLGCNFELRSIDLERMIIWPLPTHFYSDGCRSWLRRPSSPSALYTRVYLHGSRLYIGRAVDSEEASMTSKNCLDIKAIARSSTSNAVETDYRY